MPFFEKTIVFLKDRIQKLTGEEKRRIVLICTAVVVLALTFSVLMTMNNSNREEPSGEPERPAFFSPVSAEELFLPDEPDFVPGVLLERERRTSWTEQDAGVYWQDPLRFGEEQWREKIEAAIDDFLERVP